MFVFVNPLLFWNPSALSNLELFRSKILLQKKGGLSLSSRAITRMFTYVFCLLRRCKLSDIILELSSSYDLSFFMGENSARAPHTRYW